MRRGTVKKMKTFLVGEHRLKIQWIARTISDFERLDCDLETEISNEEKRARIFDPNSVAYPLSAQAAKHRRYNIRRSIDELRNKLEDAKAALAQAMDELNKIELLEGRRQETSGQSPNKDFPMQPLQVK